MSKKIKIRRKTDHLSGTSPAKTDDVRSGPKDKEYWKLLIIDDDPDVHAVTALALDGFSYQGRGLLILNAYSGTEGFEMMRRHPDIGVALVDVMMESDDAGLVLVRRIREQMKNHLVRLIIRTGQPGLAPEREVIENFDIDDYKEKTELTVKKLFTTVRSAFKGYCDLLSIENNKRGLEHILNGTPEIYSLKSLNSFFQGILTQILALSCMNHHSLISGTTRGKPPEALLAARDLDGPEEIVLRVGTGKYATLQQVPPDLMNMCQRSDGAWSDDYNGTHSICLPIRVNRELFGFVFLEGVECLGENNRRLLNLFVQQCGSAIENFRLYRSLQESNRRLVDANEHAIFMLAVASELKDKETGNHIDRIGHYSESLGLKMGLSAEESRVLGLASRLHDLGKLGIPDRIIQKPGSLTGEEFSIIKQHPGLALEILGDNPWFRLASDIAHGHHEKWDGSGYPEGKSGAAIPLSARIVAVADVFDALTSLRPYKKPWPPERALAEIRAGSGSHFDPEVVDAFTALYEEGAIQDIMGRFPSFQVNEDGG